MAAEDDYKCKQRYTRVPTSLDLSDSTTEKNDKTKDNKKEEKSWTWSGMLFKLFWLCDMLFKLISLWEGCRLWAYYMPAASEYRPFVNSFEISVPDIMSSDTTWMKLGPPLFDPDAPEKYDSFGLHRALSGDGSIVAISESYDDVGGNILFGKGEGQVWLYGWNGSKYQLTGSIIAAAMEINFGTAVKLSKDGTTLVVGSYTFLGGRVQVFDRVTTQKNDGTTWVRRGHAVVGPGFGWEVSLSADGNTIATAAVDGVHVFSWTGTKWKALGRTIPGLGPHVDLDLSGDGLTLAARGGDIIFPGHPVVYQYIRKQWMPKGVEDGRFDHVWAVTISLNHDGSIMAVGGTTNPEERFTKPFLDVFQYTGDEDGWVSIHQAKFHHNDTAVRIPHSVALSDNGKVLSVGTSGTASADDGKIPRSGGSVHIYVDKEDSWEEIFSFDGSPELRTSLFLVDISSDGNIVLGGYLDRTNADESKHGTGFVSVYGTHTIQ